MRTEIRVMCLFFCLLQDTVAKELWLYCLYIYIPFEKWRAKELRIELPNLIVYELISKLA